LPEQPDALGGVHVGHDAVEVARRVRALVVDGDLVGPVLQDVVLHRVGREGGQLPGLVGLDILRRGACYLAGGALLTKQLPSMLREPLVVAPAAKPDPAFYTGLWSAFLQVFTVDDIYHRKIK
jgi:hypothetical protein